MLGLIGANGAGKSTCLRLIMGFLQAQSGSIHVLGRPMPQAMVEVKQMAAYVSEDMQLYERASLGWHLQWVSALFPTWDNAYAQHLLHVFQLDPQRLIKELSTGQRIKAALILALARRPQLLVLDEPTTGLDPVARHEFIRELFSIMLNEEHSVIFSSQYTQDVERLSDTIAFIDEGEILSRYDKEHYLDRWRRIRLQGASPELFEGLGLSLHNANCAADELIVSDFSSSLEERILSKSPAIKLENLSLEEIFIAQVLSRRAQREAML